jgi:hypothetical protein
MYCQVWALLNAGALMAIFYLNTEGGRIAPSPWFAYVAAGTGLSALAPLFIYLWRD